LNKNKKTPTNSAHRLNYNKYLNFGYFVEFGIYSAQAQFPFSRN
jgi:hypothetical protein